jgi:hypothetical protein
MNNIKKLSILFLLLFFIGNSVSAQCDYADGFEELPPATTTGWDDELIDSRVTPTGWTCENFSVVTKGTSIQRNNYSAIGTGKQGIHFPGNKNSSILSPVLNGDISISFKCCVRNSVYERNIRIEKIQNGAATPVSGTTTTTTIGGRTTPTTLQYEVSGGTGDYQIKISVPSTDEYGIVLWDFCIITQAPTPPSISLAGVARAEGGFWDKAGVTLSAGEGSAVYYTTDGTDPATTSTPYAAPFDLTQTATIKAISVKNGASSAALDTTITVTATAFNLATPADAAVFVGAKSGKHYQPFTEKQPVYSVTADGTATRYYNISGTNNYRVSRDGSLTHAGTFNPTASTGPVKSLEITEVQLASHSPREIDHDVNSNSGRNMADIFLNINEKGYLRLASGESRQLISLRNWQAIDSDVNNYFIEPDFHYTVVDESGAPDNTVVTVSPAGVVTAVDEGTAIVLVTYDAMWCTSANVGPFFGALWPENTGVFVVSVDAPESASLKPNITINENWNIEGGSKEVSYNVDAELDIFYYLEEEGGYDYTFKPEGAMSVSIAQPAVGENSLSYTGFTPAVHNSDGSYTVRLVFGRNIVRLTAANGASEYQVMNAKPVSYTLANATREGETLQPGDEFSIVFSTLYHPCNKLSGIYNASAGIQYTGFETDFPWILGPGQYTFASRAQEYKRQIPEDYVGDEFTLTNGVIKLNGYITNSYGGHRYITLEQGVGVNMNASAHTAYFGKLPDVRINTGVFPTVPGNLIASPVDTRSIFLQWTASTDNVGVTGYTIWVNSDSLTSVSKSPTSYLVTGLEPATTCTFEVAAFDAAGNRSAKAAVTASTLTGLPDVQANSVGVYPNPFADYITVHAGVAGRVTIYDLSGKAVLTEMIQAGSAELNTASLQKGVYILKYGSRAVRIVK